MRGWICGGRHAFAPLVVVFDTRTAEACLACFSVHLCLCVHMRRTQSVYFLPHTAILVFNETFQGEPSLPWLKHKFLMDSHTRAIEMCPPGPHTSFTAATSYLLVTQRSLIQSAYGISLQQAESARGMHTKIPSVWNSRGFFSATPALSRINWTRLLDTLNMREKHLSQVKKTQKMPPWYRAIFKDSTNQSSLHGTTYGRPLCEIDFPVDFLLVP